MDTTDNTHKEENKMKSFKQLLTESHADVDKLTDLQMVRLALQEEIKAINLYEQMSQRANDPRVVKLLESLTHEEKVHSVECEELIEMIDPGYEDAEEEGEEESEDMFGDEDEEEDDEEMEEEEDAEEEEEDDEYEDDEDGMEIGFRRSY